MKKQKILLIKILTTLSFVGMVVVNALANILPINNLNTGQVSDMYPNLFAPIGLTFSIWGLIYLALFFYILYQFNLFNKKNKRREDLFVRIAPFFIISSLANIAWVFAWHYLVVWLSVLLIVIILACLIKIADILRVEKFSRISNLFISFPFSIYFGWITVAVIANITVFLVSINWDGFGLSEQLWTIIILIIGALIGSLRMIKDKNVFYGLVLVWAYFGIWLKHVSFDYFNNAYDGIIITTLFCVILFLSIVFSISLKKIKNNKVLK